MISIFVIIIIIILCCACFLIWAECSELCECCDNKHSSDTNIDTNNKLEITCDIIKSPIQSNFVEI